MNILKKNEIFKYITFYIILYIIKFNNFTSNLIFLIH